MSQTESAATGKPALGLRARILLGHHVVGTFIKTPAPQIAELLGRAGLDFAVADMEHGPIDLGALDGLALGARSTGLPLLFRSAGNNGSAIWPGLDLGCAGVMVPHVVDAKAATAIASAVKYHRGQRGFSPSGRAGDYGTVDSAEYRARMDSETVIMAQIEDRVALDRLDEIAAVPEVDVLFVGPADLSLSIGCSMDAPEMDVAIEAVIAAAKRNSKACGLFLGAPTKMPIWIAKGVSVFVCGSDQGLVLNGARALKAAVR